MLATRYPLAAKTLARNEYSVFLTVLPLLMIGDRKLPVTVLRLHLVVSAHGKVDSDGPLSCGVEQIQRLVPNAPFADGKIYGAGKGTDAQQNRDSALHRFHPDHF